MTRRFLSLAVLALLASAPVWLGRSTPVEAQPKPVGVCKPADLAKLQKELATTKEALRQSQASEAEARAELEKLRTAERERIKRLQAQTGVAAEKLN